ncbi:hypothetical protein PHMEG_00030151 [Phytophthora megakarya]|uniref:Uncharacterized protein n=1 Tax=Phytophthora megakarya TaxID=4795 RepID=A0A225V135_9STRA|nr:hypothetical protein PHMEG_00030151 [Phytophthora megakarya]
MVDFNRWLAEVLEDTHTEGIVWEPTYSDNPWLALEEQQPQNASLDEAFTRDSTTTIQLLGTACEIYMERYERLQQTNIGLAVELEQLKIQLKEALVRAFDTQQILDREREVAALQTRRLVMGVQIGEHLSQRNSHDRGQIELHQQITDAFRMLDTVNAPREVVEEMPGLGREPTSENASEQRRSDESEGASAQTNEPEHTGDVEAGSANQEVVILCPLTKDDTAHPDPEVVSQSSQDHFDDSDPTPSSSDANDDRTDYSQLTQLRPREEKSGNWYQYALQTLKEKRNQRRLLRKTNAEPAEAPLVARPTPSVAYDKSSSFDAQEFVKLAATRENGEDLTWYRRALQHLKEERTSRLSLHDRESFASTISTID